MTTVERTLDVHVPIQTAYNQWTQFEDFPQFMEGIESVQQLEDNRLHWRATIFGVSTEWDAVITQQIPDERIAWESTSGATNNGMVSFHRIDDNITRILMQLTYEPEGIVEYMGDLLGIITQRVENDLMNFKNFIESRENATGAWRGTIENESSTTPA
jgi:uncharacterized membrane protein